MNEITKIIFGEIVFDDDKDTALIYKIENEIDYRGVGFREFAADCIDYGVYTDYLIPSEFTGKISIVKPYTTG